MKRRRKLAVADVESPQRDLRRVAGEQVGEHLAVIASDVAEPFEDVIAFEYTDLHRKIVTDLERISIACRDESKIQHKGSKEQSVRGSLGRNPRPLFEPLFL